MKIKKKLKAIPLREFLFHIRNKTRQTTLSVYVFNIILEYLAGAIRQLMYTNNMQTGKEEVKNHYLHIK